MCVTTIVKREHTWMSIGKREDKKLWIYKCFFPEFLLMCFSRDFNISGLYCRNTWNNI